MLPVVDTPVLAISCAIWGFFYRNGRPASVRGPRFTTIQSLALKLTDQGREDEARRRALFFTGQTEPDLPVIRQAQSLPYGWSNPRH